MLSLRNKNKYAQSTGCHNIYCFHHGEDGQLTAFDGIFFLIIIAIASAIVHFATANIVRESASVAEVPEDYYVRDFHTSVLSSTLRETGYYNITSSQWVKLYDATVQEAIERYLEAKSTDILNGNIQFDMIEMENAIRSKYELGLIEGYHYAVHATIEDPSGALLFISDKIKGTYALPDVRRASRVETTVDSTRVVITLYIWK